MNAEEVTKIIRSTLHMLMGAGVVAYGLLSASVDPDSRMMFIVIGLGIAGVEMGGVGVAKAVKKK